MAGYVVRRVLWLAPLLWAIATITFFLMHAAPGGPFDREKRLSDETIRNLEEKYSLDEPLLKQYGLYLRDLLRGDLGVSVRSDRPVTELLREALPVSAQLGAVAFVFAVIVGLALGVTAAVYHRRWPDYAGVAFATAGAALPSFVLAGVLVTVFSVKLGWFDALGWELGNPRKMVLPALVLGLLPAAYLARVTRASVLDALSQEYVRTARAKGLSEVAVVARHALRNALVPVLTLLGPMFAVLITGSFIVERAFAINGAGSYFVDSVFGRDYRLIMTTTLLYATVVAVANLVVDVLYAVIDPRVRYGAS